MITKRCERRGLSTLELVLALPLLLAVMALMLNYGTVASWKVRGNLAARHAAWATRWPRTGDRFPRPAYWPATANMGSGGAADAPRLDDPGAYHPVARGPLPYGTTVNDRLLDPSRGFRSGSAHLERRFPLMASLGGYRLDARVQLLDDPWQYQRLGLPSNRSRRIPVIYALARAPGALSQTYVRAVLSILRAPFRRDLYPLDRDEEWWAYHNRFPLAIGTPPDFHPRLACCLCTLDRQLVQGRVEDLIDRIQGKVERDAQNNVTRRIPCLADPVSRGFIGLYEQAIRQLENLKNAVPPPPPAQRGAIQAEIDALQAKVDTLQQFLQTLP